MKPEKAKIKEELGALKDCDPETLRGKYRELTGADAAAFGTKFMQRRCAHRLQELAFGSLTDAERATLAYIAEHDPGANPSLRDAPRSANGSWTPTRQGVPSGLEPSTATLPPRFTQALSTPSPTR